jgi:lactoylglutathione lyase
VPDPPGTRIDHVGLSVADLDETAGWYCRALDLTEVARFEYPIGRRSVAGVLLAARDGWRLELQRCDGSQPAQPANPLEALLEQGIGHFCLEVPDLDAAFALLVERGAGISVPPTSSPVPGMRIAYVTDPEGNFVELLEQKDPDGA